MATPFVKITKSNFFDRPGVIAAMADKARRVLSSTGAYARTVMMRGMKSRPGPSPPRAYPHAHENPLLRDRIFFAADLDEQSVIIGPQLLRGRGRNVGFDRDLVGGSKSVPQLVNEGGLVVRQRAVRSGQRLIRTRPEIQIYRPRPFVELTAPKAARKLAENMENMPLRGTGATGARRAVSGLLQIIP